MTTAAELLERQADEVQAIGEEHSTDAVEAHDYVLTAEILRVVARVLRENEEVAA